MFLSGGTLFKHDSSEMMLDKQLGDWDGYDDTDSIVVDRNRRKRIVSESELGESGPDVFR